MFKSISDVRTFNKSNGFHFFDCLSMKTLGSKVEGGLFAGEYFITSEDCATSHNGARRYTVRKALGDGRIQTIGAYQAHETRKEAKAVIEFLKAVL